MREKSEKKKHENSFIVIYILGLLIFFFQLIYFESQKLGWIDVLQFLYLFFSFYLLKKKEPGIYSHKEAVITLWFLIFIVMVFKLSKLS